MKNEEEPLRRREFLRNAAFLAAGAALVPTLPVLGCAAPHQGADSGGARAPQPGTNGKEASGDRAAVPPTQPGMMTRPVPSSGEQLPVIGMGTWQTFDPRSVDESSLAPLVGVLEAFYAAGGRVVDSSPMYGKSEAVTGQLADRLKINDRLFVATKVWTRGERTGIEQMERSLGELRRERVELLQVHNLVDWQTHLTTLRRWKDQGRVRYIGVTHYQVRAFDDLESIIRRERLDFVQLPYSPALRDAEARLLPAAADAGTAVLVNRPFEGGDLFGRVRGTPLPPDVGRYAGSWAQAFLKFIIAHPAVTCVIPATSKPRNMRDNVAAGTGPLPTPAERDALARLVRG